MSDRRRDDELLDLLEDLGETLEELGTELREERAGDRDTLGQFQPPRPPTFGEVMRFTESYTIPTVIAVLEATIASLELLRKLMRLSDPDRAFEDDRFSSDPRLREAPRAAVSGVERALNELRTALSEADLPSNPEARDILDRARTLTDELDARIDEAQRDRTDRERRWRDDETRFESRWRRDDTRGRSRERSTPVRIDVTDENDDDDAADSPDEPTEIDVDAELESIKREVNGDEDEAADGEGGEGGKDGEN
ncbi:hypothetical protein ACFQJC_11345 [Haloferax namakaokahaiae]|uniref:Uncharacterized protein n=1 Tax=Haloferax namakaokahaiae TaxID=1748331 RepID=A0ABD5ZFT5_9EURY